MSQAMSNAMSQTMSNAMSQIQSSPLVYLGSDMGANSVASYKIQFDHAIQNVTDIELIGIVVQHADVICRKGRMQFICSDGTTYSFCPSLSDIDGTINELNQNLPITITRNGNAVSITADTELSIDDKQGFFKAYFNITKPLIWGRSHTPVGGSVQGMIRELSDPFTIPAGVDAYTIPAPSRSVGVIVETLNGVRIHCIESANPYNGCIHVSTGNSDMIAPFCSCIRFHLSLKQSINGFHVRLIYADGSPYAINELTNEGTSMIMLRLIQSNVDCAYR